MEFQSGKHAGKSYEEIVLKNADYVAWIISEHGNGRPAKELKRLIGIFNAKPFTSPCHGCGAPATRTTIYINNYDPMYWCDDCDPYGQGANKGKLNFITTYGQAIAHIASTAGNKRDWKCKVIRCLAEGKGLPKRVGSAQALAFFA